ncbi:hypothetical protein MMC13_008476 [Lambiella insularis]|nr:hypothetical protein [Lambiella insularis]
MSFQRMQRNVTTFDLVKKHDHHVPALSGAKRPHNNESGATYAALQDPSVLKSLSRNADHGFKRPRVDQCVSHRRLNASEIHHVGELPSSGPTIYTQRRLASSVPRASQNPLLFLNHHRYNLPEKLVQNFASLGISSIYPWQSSCLLGRGLLEGEKNLVYTAPTGGGKSLVADVLMLKRVLEGKKAILVLPYVALVQEKLNWLRRAVDGMDKFGDHDQGADRQGATRFRKSTEHRSVRVVGFFGGSKARETWIDVDIAICTIEKVRDKLDDSCLKCGLSSKRRTHL